MHRVVHTKDPLRVPSIPSQYHDGVGDDSCNSAGWGGARAPASDKISRSVSLGLSLKYPSYPITTKFESVALSLITTFLRRVCSHTTSPISFSIPFHGLERVARSSCFDFPFPMFSFYLLFYDIFSISTQVVVWPSFLLEKRDDSPLNHWKRTKRR